MRSSPGLVGRDRELAAIRSILDDAQTGSRGVVVVDGDAGMGKTALVRAAVATNDLDLVWVGGDEAELAVDRGIIDQIVRALRTPDRSVDLMSGPTSDPVRSGTALVATIDRLDVTPERPLVVVVDDAQWADTVSLQAIAFAARRLHGDPVVFILTVRGTAAAVLPDGLWRLAETHGVHVRVDPLSQDQVATLAHRLLGQAIPAAAAARLAGHTAGSPLHLAALLHEVTFDEVVGLEDLPAPRSFAMLIGVRLARCDAAVSAVTGAVCVLGGAASLSSLATLSGLDDPRPAVDDAVAAGLLTVVPPERTGAPRVEAAHPLVRAAVLEHLSLTRRAELHRAAGALLGGPAGIHHRLVGALGPDPDLWHEATEAASEQSRSGFHGSAASLLLGSARVAPTEATRDRSLLDGVHELLLAGRTAEADSLRADVDATSPSARRSFVQGHLAFALGPRDRVAEFLTEAWDALVNEADGEDAVLASTGDRRVLAADVAAQLAIASVNQARGSDALRWARTAEVLDATQAAMSTTAHAVASGHALSGTLADGIAELDRRCAEARSLGAVVMADAQMGRGITRLWTHDLPGAAADLESTVAAGEAVSFVAHEAARSHLADVYFRQGRWDEAVLTAQRAASVLDDTDHSWVGYMPATTLARVLAARGQDGAAELLDHAQSLSMDSGSIIGVGYVWLGRIEVAACRRYHETVAHFGDLIAAAGVPDFVGAWRASHVEALVALDRIDDAAKAADGLDTELSTPLQATDAARAAVCVAMANDDNDGADRAADDALALNPDRVGTYPRARLELVVGRAWRRRGERRRAAEILEAARDRFTALGAVAWLDQVDVEIAALGLRPVRRSGRAAHELTPQEQAVAQLVAKGLKNREVAAELVVSAKTIEHHLSRVYAKVGVRSRTELAHLILSAD